MVNFERLTDEELAMLYIGGNDSAFDELLSRTQEKVFSYIMFVVKDVEIANDLFQDTFVKIIVRLQQGRYVSSGKLLFWMIRIAHNNIMDWYRKQKNDRIIELYDTKELSNLAPTSHYGINREDEYVNEQVHRDVKKLMQLLHPPQREVVYMRFYQNLSFKEISEITGVSINTSLGRMRYALLNMRKMANDHHIELRLEQ